MNLKSNISKTLIIAEAGVNHNGDINNAYRLIDAAVTSGADIIKFQTFEANSLATEYAKKANYQKNRLSEQESQYQMLKKLELSKEDHFKIIKYCKKCNIEFFSSAFDLKSLDFLNSLKLSRYKIPSGEITNLPYLRKIASYKKPIILSTGMANLTDISNAVNVFEEAGLTKNMITVLHCSTEYPAPINEVNLNAMLTIKKTFDVKVGYSDHTSGIEVSIAAVALGAAVIEKHLTLDKNLPGPDHAASTEPDNFLEMVKAIRNIEKAMGNGNKEPTKSEKKNMLVARKSIVALKNISKGDIFNENNLTVKRPGIGISPMRIYGIFGQKAHKDFQENDIITLK
jgi:N,N'-diacetyllegionaminate synthase